MHAKPAVAGAPAGAERRELSCGAGGGTGDAFEGNGVIVDAAGNVELWRRAKNPPSTSKSAHSEITWKARMLGSCEASRALFVLGEQSADVRTTQTYDSSNQADCRCVRLRLRVG